MQDYNSEVGRENTDLQVNSVSHIMQRWSRGKFKSAVPSGEARSRSENRRMCVN